MAGFFGRLLKRGRASKAAVEPTATARCPTTTTSSTDSDSSRADSAVSSPCTAAPGVACGRPMPAAASAGSEEKAAGLGPACASGGESIDPVLGMPVDMPALPSGAKTKEMRRAVKQLMKRLHRTAKDGKSVQTGAGVTRAEYEAPPYATGDEWVALGELLKTAEQATPDLVHGSSWMTLRLRLHDSTRLMNLLRQRHVLEPAGFSKLFAEGMNRACMSLMARTCAWVGFAQGDEMTLLIPPAAVVKGVRQTHLYEGCAHKMATLAASHVANVFNDYMAFNFKYGIATMYAEKAKQIPTKGNYTYFLGSNKPYPFDLCGAFDCRIGIFQTRREAVGLMMWRSYVAQKEAVLHACVAQHGVIEGAAESAAQSTIGHLKFLKQHELLPLPALQVYGAYFVRGLPRADRAAGFTFVDTRVVLDTPQCCIDERPHRCFINLVLEDGLLGPSEGNYFTAQA
eukprot:TRINITY_DN12503_c0_g1_i1.p1 TRINITY_DN12503_c0_g1~~TRINITY_DN12503_c0_g1_i1.p1  ORF type:complete len:456 (+),score=134.65 TRINITY_DN12503_c0_g1_i1:45-1412(+)